MKRVLFVKKKYYNKIRKELEEARHLLKNICDNQYGDEPFCCGCESHIYDECEDYCVYKKINNFLSKSEK